MNFLLLLIFVCLQHLMLFAFFSAGTVFSSLEIYLYIGITSCDYKITQLFDFCNTEYCIN